jgi:hypothetical protein
MGYVRFARLLLTYRRRVYGEAWLVMATEYHALEDWMAVTLEDDSNFYNPPPWTSLAIRVRIEPPPLCRFFRTPWFFFRKDVYDKLKKTGFAKLLVFDIFDERPP